MTSPFLRSDEACVYLRFVRPDGTPDLKGFDNFARRQDIRRWKRGRRTLYDRADLDMAIGRQISTARGISTHTR